MRDSRESVSVNPPNERLAGVDVEENAFGMIGKFKVALRELPAFRAQVPDLDLYFGESNDGQSVVRSGKDTWVHFSIDNFPYRVVYECSKDKQRLDFVRGVMDGNPGVVPNKDHIILESRRFEDQMGNPSARITYVGSHYEKSDIASRTYNKYAFSLAKSSRNAGGVISSISLEIKHFSISSQILQLLKL